MFVTLLLPIVIPYGNPVTAHNPKAHSQRKAEFFKWIESVKYQRVPLTEDLEEREGIPFPITVPLGVTAQ